MKCDIHKCNAQGTTYRFKPHGTAPEVKCCYCEQHATEFKRIFGPHGMIRPAPSDRPATTHTTTDKAS